MKNILKNFLGFLLIFLGDLQGSEQKSPRLRDPVVVERASFYLEDLMDHIPPSVAQEAAGVSLGQSPAPGQKKNLSIQELEKKLNLFSWPVFPSLREVTLSRKSQRWGIKEIETLIHNKMEEISAGDQWKMIPDQRILSFDVSLDPLEQPVLRDFDYDPTRHRFSATLLMEDMEMPRSFPLSGRLIRVLSVPVLKTTKGMGDLIQDQDIIFLSFQQDQLPPHVLLEKSQIVGMVSKNGGIKSHEPLRSTALTKPLMVRRGHVVSLILETPHLSITHRKAEVLEDGIEGQFIKVKNLDSGRIIVGKVKEPGLIEVSL